MSPLMKAHKIDTGRLIAAPVFAFCMTFSFLVVCRDIRALSPINTTKSLLLIHHVLSVGFYALVIFLYFIRSSASSTSRSHITNFIAVVVSFIPFTIPFLGKSPPITKGILLLANLIITFGIVLSIYSVYSLGRSFSIIPQARKLVRSGPYRLVRHPLYVSELISVFGIVLGGFTIPKMILYFVLVVCQAYRAFQEEKLLADVFPDYKEYASRTGRFIPLLFLRLEI